MSIADASCSNYHNAFEKHHRFIGWLGLAVCIIPSKLKIMTKNYSEYLDLCDPWQYLWPEARPMENRRPFSSERSRTMVRCLDDNIVCITLLRLLAALLMLYSILIPWVTLREVPVEVEIVSFPLFLALLALTKALAITESCCYPFWSRDAARFTWEDQSYLDNGIPRVWNNQRGQKIFVSLYDLWGTGGLYKKYCRRSTQNRVDSTIEVRYACSPLFRWHSIDVSSWGWARLCNVQERNPHMYWYWYWCSPIYLYPESWLVSRLLTTSIFYLIIR